jgi:putative glutamine amidotransferase
MRDAVTLPLIRGAVAAGVPLLAVCRGLQEFNVAMGGSLHQRLQDLPGRMDHSTPMQPNPRVRTAKAHGLSIVKGSWLHRVVGATEITVNSLHNEGINQLAPGLVAEATAPDGTIEAIRATAAPGLAVGVQWHPEYDWERNPMSRRILEAFGAAVRSRMMPQSAAAD